MRPHRHVTALFGLGALAASGLCLLWTTSPGAAERGKGLQSYVAVPYCSESAPIATGSVSLVAITDLPAPEQRVTQVQPASSALSSDSPRTLQVAQWQVSGRVVALDGLPLSGHSIRLGGDAPGMERTRSDAAGDFTMSMPARSDVLVAGAPGFVTVAGTRASRGKEGLIVALPAHQYTVTVGDAKTGLPLTAARVTPVPSDTLHTSLEATRLDLAPDAVFVSGALPSSSTSRAGLAAFDELPGPQWVDALITRPGYDDQRVSFEATTDGNLAVWLEPIGADDDWAGRVVDADGRPLSSAWIICGSESVRAAGDGSFSLPSVEFGIEFGGNMDAEPVFIDAYHPGHGAVRIELTQAPKAPIEVRIPSRVDALRVRLLAPSESGAMEPIIGARVLPVTGSQGGADFLGPFWRTGQTDGEGFVQLPPAMGGTPMVAYSKGGTQLGRFELRAGDIELATN